MIFCAAISVAGAVLTQTCIPPKGDDSKLRPLLDVEGLQSGDDSDDNDSIVQ